MEVRENILSKLKLAGSIGMRCCLLEPEEVEEVKQNWLGENEPYYLTEDNEGTWLNWE